ncbi:hypothetical protein [Noviluteimonas gilva]|uniref:Uncharacterized protein n=1 Tax=Noviluteimonas gilva TaxID=2682097 RepID=A0A7C9HLA9_9GAMM|nr:hypothetical protein [Lysobacter gilvus]MUV13550.1 hypothetical protein [Lysobacter gilvus]
MSIATKLEEALANPYDFKVWLSFAFNEGHEVLALVKAMESAPIVEIDGEGPDVALIANGSSLDNAITSARVCAMHGKRVALVEPPK